MALYSEKVMEHFRNPRNVGVIEDANGIGEVGNAKCGDIMKMYLKIEDDQGQACFGSGKADQPGGRGGAGRPAGIQNALLRAGGGGHPRGVGRLPQPAEIKDFRQS